MRTASGLEPKRYATVQPETVSQRVLRTQSPLATTTITSLLALPLLVLIGGYELITHQDHPRHGPRPTLRRYHGFDRGFPLLERRDRADRT